MPYRGIKKGNYISCYQKNYKVDDIIKDQRTGEDAFYKLENYPGGWVHVSQISYIDFSVLGNNTKHLGKGKIFVDNQQYPQFKYIHEFQNFYKNRFRKHWRGVL